MKLSRRSLFRSLAGLPAIGLAAKALPPENYQEWVPPEMSEICCTFSSVASRADFKDIQRALKDRKRG